MSPLVFFGSLGGVLAVAALVWWLGFGEAEQLDENAAMAEAEAQRPGFQAVKVSTLGDAMMVEGADGERVRLRRLGARWVAE